MFGEKGVIRRSSSTVFLATHSTDYLQAADQVVTIDKFGNVSARRGVNRSNLASSFLDQLDQSDIDIRKEKNGIRAETSAYNHTIESRELHTGENPGFFSMFRYYFAATSKAVFFIWLVGLWLLNLGEMSTGILWIFGFH